MDKDAMIKKLTEKIYYNCGSDKCKTELESAEKAAEISWDFFLAYEAEVLIGYFSNLKSIEERLEKIESFLQLRSNV